MFWSKKKNTPYHESPAPVKMDEIGLVIQFIPNCAIYLYISKDGFISMDESYGDACLSMIDSNGLSIEIAGNYISLELTSETEIEQAIERYQLAQFHLPIIKIPVQTA